MTTNPKRTFRSILRSLASTGAPVLLLGASLTAGCVSSGSEGGRSVRSRERSFLLTYEARVPRVTAGTRMLRLWAPVPETDPFQEVGEVTLDCAQPCTLRKEAEYGNRVAYIEVTDPPITGVTLRYQCRVTRREAHAGVDQTPASARFLLPDALIPLEGRAQEIAGQVAPAGMSVPDAGRRLYDFVLNTMTYSKSGTGWGKGDFNFACEACQGNCTDFHAMFIGAARARNIPARFEMGLSLPMDQRDGALSGYHCWAFYHDGQGWVPVDISEADKMPRRHSYYYGNLDVHRVRLSTGRDIRLDPPQQGEALSFFHSPYAEADGKSCETTRSASFRDLP
ncbi:MAG: transglutaminase domain-containing protein [Planctomycetes bacterium]|nr:transglutaminase domain-containing protein [Planctomycetota bacterium]